MAIRFRIYPGNDNIVELEGLKDAVQGTFINTASVNVILVDEDGVQVPGQVWPVTMSYVPTSNGIYRATLDDSVEIVKDKLYIAEIRADAGADLKGFWSVDCWSARREAA